MKLLYLSMLLITSCSVLLMNNVSGSAAPLTPPCTLSMTREGFDCENYSSSQKIGEAFTLLSITNCAFLPIAAVVSGVFCQYQYAVPLCMASCIFGSGFCYLVGEVIQERADKKCGIELYYASELVHDLNSNDSRELNI